MPDDIKPDASSDEELQPDNEAAAENADSMNEAESGSADESGSSSEAAKAENDVAENGDALAVAEENADSDSESGDGSDSEDQKGAEPVVNEGDASEEDAEAAMLAMMEQDDSAKKDSNNGVADEADDFPDLSGVKMEEAPAASQAQFQQLSPTPSTTDANNIDLLLDVKMPVAIELGRTEMPISELLTLGPGSVIELNKLAGEPVDLLVNGKIIARGEVVVVDENFGVRITLLLSPEERLKTLAQE